MRASTLLACLSLSSVISAQLTPAQIAAQIPSCIRPCDIKAILSVGCGLTDYACQCAHGPQLNQIIPSCLRNSSNCTVAQYMTFGKLVGELCTAVNVTGNATTTTSASVKPSATGYMEPYEYSDGAGRIGTGVVVLFVGSAVMLLL